MVCPFSDQQWPNAFDDVQLSVAVVECIAVQREAVLPVARREKSDLFSSNHLVRAIDDQRDLVMLFFCFVTTTFSMNDRSNHPKQ